MNAPHKQQIIEETRRRVEYPELLQLLASYATSLMGKQAVLELEPFSDPAEMRWTLGATEELRDLIRERFSLRLKDLGDVAPLLAEGIGTRVLESTELYDVYRVLDVARGTASVLSTRPSIPNLAELTARLPDLPELRERLELSVGARGDVLDSASPELTRLRREYEKEEDGLRQWMDRRRQHTSLRGALQGDVVSIRNGRFVFAVRVEHRSKVRGIVHGESSSGATLFIEPEQIVLRGNHLADLAGQVRREIHKILVELTTRVRAERQQLRLLVETLTLLDGLLARARFAEAFGAHSPTLTDERDLQLVGARHPLLMWRERKSELGIDEIDLEHVHNVIVPVDLELGRSHHQMVITGPNTGGKTVVLKVAGLLVLMAYTGIPIPAAPGTRLPIFDRVLADIGDEQSLEQNLSTFSAHMTVTADILRTASSRSLVLLDELGAGTDPYEGAALAEAILERLYKRGAFTLVSTHLGSLKEFAFQHKKCENACMEFDPEKVSPTYRLLSGLPGRSSALIIARRIGVPAEVVDYAERLGGASDASEAVIEGMERAKRQLEQKRNEMEKERKTAHRLREDAEDEYRTIQKMRRAIDHEAESAEEERVRRAISAVEAALKELGEPPRDRRDAYDRLLESLTQAARQTTLAQRRHQTAQGLKKGDAVFVPKLGAVSEVKKINKGKELITVEWNGIPMQVPFGEISWIIPPPGYQREWYD